MKVLYECELCHEQFGDEKACRFHEASHLEDVERAKYLIRYFLHEDVCVHCKRSFYVYGCELDCMFDDCGPHNNYKDFVKVIKNDFKGNVCKYNDPS